MTYSGIKCQIYTHSKKNLRNRCILFVCCYLLSLILICINESINSPYPPYTSIPKLSLLQERSVKTCNCNHLSW